LHNNFDRTRFPLTPDRLTKVTLTDHVYHQIRNEILFGRLKPNELLVESDIAARLNVSRTPVRETLQRLVSDGLVVSHRRRWLVYGHEPSEIREIYETRMALEGFAARLASERATDHQVGEIAAAMRVLEGPSSRGEARVVANGVFHDLIISAANNGHLAEEIQRSRRYYFNIGAASEYTPADITISQQQHVDLLSAIQEHDGDRAEAMCRDHISRALSLILGTPNEARSSSADRQSLLPFGSAD